MLQQFLISSRLSVHHFRLLRIFGTFAPRFANFGSIWWNIGWEAAPFIFWMRPSAAAQPRDDAAPRSAGRRAPGPHGRISVCPLASRPRLRPSSNCISFVLLLFSEREKRAQSFFSTQFKSHVLVRFHVLLPNPLIALSTRTVFFSFPPPEFLRLRYYH